MYACVVAGRTVRVSAGDFSGIRDIVRELR
jgi:hypothetical protein